MSDQASLARAWLLKADSDSAAARHIIAAEGPYDTACFHAQQAIEKILKAFLAFHRQRIPRTHDLEELGRLCQQIESILDVPLTQLVEITDYAVQIRYDLDTWPTQDEARDALNLAGQIRAVILAHLPGESCP